MCKFYGYRKNRQWVATWRSTTGSILSQGGDSEQKAKVFEQNLQLIAEKERVLLKKRKRNQVNSPKITVNDLIAQCLASQGNPVHPEAGRVSARRARSKTDAAWPMLSFTDTGLPDIIFFHGATVPELRGLFLAEVWKPAI